MKYFGWSDMASPALGRGVERAPAARLENIRFLSAHRRDWLFNRDLLYELLVAELEGVPLAQVPRCLPDQPESHVRSAVHHPLWAGRLEAAGPSLAAGREPSVSCGTGRLRATALCGRARPRHEAVIW